MKWKGGASEASRQEIPNAMASSGALASAKTRGWVEGSFRAL